MSDPSPDLIERARRVLVDEGADSEGGWHSWRCFDKERYPEPCDCTAEISRAILSAVLPGIIQQAKAEAWEEGAHTAWERSTSAVNGASFYWRHDGEPANPYRAITTALEAS